MQGVQQIKPLLITLGGLSAMTGGRANSWAGTVASNARGNMLMQAEEAVMHFEDRAYSRI